MNIIGTGLSGLVGSRVRTLLSSEYGFENLSLETGVDIRNKKLVMERIASSPAPWIFHFAAATDLDTAEKERPLRKKSTAWQVNVEGTRNIAEAAKKYGKHVVYLSTDFVFDGNNPPYSEDSMPNPQSWYASTKYEGEKIISGIGDQGLVIRIAFPYGTSVASRPDFVQRMKRELQAGKTVYAVHDQLITPTFIDYIVRVIDALIKTGASGIYHAVGSEAISPYSAALLIADALRFNQKMIAPITWALYYKNRAPRPIRAVLKNVKISSLGVSMIPFREGVRFTV